MTDNPPHATTSQYGSRFYTWGDQKYYSVTTILDVLSKPALVRWAAKVVAEKAWETHSTGDLNWLLDDKDGWIKALANAPNEIREDSATAGRKVHKWIEQWIGDADDFPEPPEGLESWGEQFFAFLHEYEPEFTHSEVQVFNRSRAYAGTLDAICTIGGETWIIDIKTGKSVWPEHALQLAAYANAEFIASEDGYDELPMPKIDRAAILHLRPRSHRLVEVDISSETFKSFLFIQQAFMWRQTKESEVLMDQVPFVTEVEE